jgi:hypothetical protein
MHISASGTIKYDEGYKKEEEEEHKDMATDEDEEEETSYYKDNLWMDDDRV